MKLVNINRMEIFRPGTWNGIEFKETDLYQMEENFRILQATLRPKLKITHRDDQESLAGLASYGDITNVWIEKVQGEARLFCNVERVPEEVANWIRSGRFSERSIELWLMREVDGKTYRNVLTAVSLLGAEIPAVAGLNPVLAKDKGGVKVVDISNPGSLPQGMAAVGFSFDDAKGLEIIQDKNNGKGGHNVTIEQQIAQMQARITTLEDEKKALELKMKDQAHAGELETFKAQVNSLKEQIDQLKEFKAQTETLKAENARLKQEKEAAETEKQTFAENARKEKVASILKKFKAAGKIVPAVEEKARELLMSLNDTAVIKKFSEEVEGKTIEVGYSQLRLFEAILSSLPKAVEFSELGPNGDDDDDEPSETEGAKKFKHGKDTYAVKNDELASRAKKLMAKDPKLTFEAALTQASKELKAEGVKQ